MSTLLATGNFLVTCFHCDYQYGHEENEYLGNALTAKLKVEEHLKEKPECAKPENLGVYVLREYLYER